MIETVRCLYKKKQVNARGRGMIEMLGVLAIIGVLSIVGLVVYRVAMTKHQSNQIIEDVKSAAFEIVDSIHQELPEDGSEIELAADRFKHVTGRTFYAFKDGDGAFALSVKSIPEELCSELMKHQDSEWLLAVQTADEKGCLKNAPNDMEFYLKEGFSGLEEHYECDPECGENSRCVQNNVCLCYMGYHKDEDGECVKDCEEGSCPEGQYCDKTCKPCPEVQAQPEDGCWTEKEDVCGNPAYEMGSLITHYRLNDEGCVETDDFCEYYLESLEPGWQQEQLVPTCEFCDENGRCSGGCDVGTYRNGAECVPCPNGVFSCTAEGAISCSENYYLKGTECLPCGEFGKNSEDNMRDSCSCTTGDWDAAEGFCRTIACTSNLDCNGGGYCENGICKMCEEYHPYYDEATKSCLQCISDNDCQNGAKCTSGFCLCQDGDPNCNCSTNQYYSLNNSECALCIGCPTNAFCSGDNNVRCQNGYVKNEYECFVFCCPEGSYFTGHGCQECPNNASCNGTEDVICDTGRHINGTLYKSNVSCDVCTDGEFLTTDGECLSCIERAICEKDYIICDTDYVGNQLTSDRAACCHKTNEFFLKGECLACPENATCDGSDFVCKEGLTKTEKTCESRCVTDGSATCAACNPATPYFDGSVCKMCIIDANCPENHTCSEGSCLLSDANCSKNQFYWEEWGECFNCLERATCNGQTLTCKEGYKDNRSSSSYWYPYNTPCCSDDQYWNDSMDGWCDECPKNATCDGTNEVSCKSGYTKTEMWECVICCGSDSYVSDWYYCDDERACQKCPDHGICNGTTTVSCEEGYHVRWYDGTFECVHCLEDGHCVAGQKCDTNTNNCLACPTDGGSTCPTCRETEKNYWNGTACVRCITNENCDRNGTCSEENLCTNQTQCNPGQFWRESWGECHSCPSRATCDGTEKYVCNSGTVDNGASADYWYDTPCCTTDQYWSNNYGEGWCNNCPKNASCNGSDSVTCSSGYTKNVFEDYGSGVYCCHSTNEYFARWYGECRTCPENATCNGTENATCNEGYTMQGYVEDGNFYCAACEYGQFKAEGSCHQCPSNAECDGRTPSCHGDYVAHNLETSQAACCHKRNQFLSNGSCASCPENATCDGTDFTCNEGFAKDGVTCKVTCATDGSATCSLCNPSTPYFNGTVCKMCVADENCSEEQVCVDGSCAHTHRECTVNQFYWENWGECMSCPNNATCDGKTYTCKTGYIDNGADSWYPYGGTPCCSSNQFWSNEYGEGWCDDCPKNASCDGSSNISCASGYQKANVCGGVVCCGTDSYISDWYCEPERACKKCPEHGVCNGTDSVSCETGSYIRWYDGEFKCVECTEDGHCPAGSKCRCDGSICQCESCPTDGSSTCPTCRETEKNYWNGSACVRCVIDGNCDRNGVCQNNVCANQTPCNSGNLWRESWGECQGCPSYASCDGTDKYVCNSGYIDNGDGTADSFEWSSPCCNKNQYWYETEYGESWCSNCPQNAVCNGRKITACSNGYKLNKMDEDWYGSGSYCCSLKQYFGMYECCSCPDHAVCNGDGTITWDEGYENDPDYCWTNEINGRTYYEGCGCRARKKTS